MIPSKFILRKTHCKLEWFECIFIFSDFLIDSNILLFFVFLSKIEEQFRDIGIRVWGGGI